MDTNKPSTYVDAECPYMWTLDSYIIAHDLFTVEYMLNSIQIGTMDDEGDNYSKQEISLNSNFSEKLKEVNNTDCEKAKK